MFRSLSLAIAIFGLSLSCFAADKKLGNVIVVERDIENISSQCLSHLETSGSGGHFFCNVDILRSPVEVLLSRGGALHHKSRKCNVTAEYGRSSLMIFITADKESTKSDAANCLRDALNQPHYLTAIVQTIE